MGPSGAPRRDAGEFLEDDYYLWGDHPAREQWEVLKDLGEGAFSQVGLGGGAGGGMGRVRIVVGPAGLRALARGGGTPEHWRFSAAGAARVAAGCGS